METAAVPALQVAAATAHMPDLKSSVASAALEAMAARPEQTVRVVPLVLVPELPERRE